MSNKIVCVTFLLFFLSSGFALGAELNPCPTYPVPSKAEGATIYKDKAGSIADPEKVRQRNEKVAPLRKFVTEASQRVDSDQHADQECAFKMMQGWAQGHALLDDPDDFNGQRERLEYALPLNVIAIKLKARGFKIDSLNGWLGDLTHGVMRDFAKLNHVGNLYIWSGTVAASFGVLSGEEDSKHYEDKVWEFGIQSIRSDGYIDRELKREGRATLYHMYNFSALLTLQTFRGALGEALSAGDRAALKRLSDRVAGALCDPTGIAAAAGGHNQEKFAFSSGDFVHCSSGIAAFGKILSDGPPFGRCGPQVLPQGFPVLGGRFDKTTQALAALKK